MTEQTTSGLPDIPIRRATRQPKRRLFFLATLLPVLVLGILAGLTYDQIRSERLTNALLRELHHEKSDRKKILLLIDQGANPNVPIRQKPTKPRSFYQQMLTVLQGRKQNGTGSPLLKQAALTNDRELVHTLLKHGAQPDANGEDSETRLYFAGQKTPLILAVLLDRADTVDELLAGGANPNYADASGRTALSYAVSILSAMNALEEYKSDTAPPMELFILMWIRGEEFSRANQRKGSKKQQEAAEGEFAMQIFKESTHIVQALLTARSDPNRKDKQGKRPMDYIVYPKKNADLIAQLKQAGAKD